VFSAVYNFEIILTAKRSDKNIIQKFFKWTKITWSKGKSKVHLNQATKAQRGSRGTRSLTSALDWVGIQRHVPATLPPENTRYPSYRKLGEPQRHCGRVRKISPPPGFDSLTVQHEAIRCTDWATPAHELTEARNTNVRFLLMIQFRLYEHRPINWTCCAAQLLNSDWREAACRTTCIIRKTVNRPTRERHC